MNGTHNTHIAYLHFPVSARLRFVTKLHGLGCHIQHSVIHLYSIWHTYKGCTDLETRTIWLCCRQHSANIFCAILWDRRDASIIWGLCDLYVTFHLPRAAITVKMSVNIFKLHVADFSYQYCHALKDFRSLLYADTQTVSVGVQEV